MHGAYAVLIPIPAKITIQAYLSIFFSLRTLMCDIMSSENVESTRFDRTL